MPDQEVIVINCYGDVVKGAKVKSLKREHPTVRVSAPGYIERTVVLDFNTSKADLVVLRFDVKTAKGPGLEEACFQNLEAAAGAVHLSGANFMSARHWSTTVHRQQDRCYFKLFDGDKFAKSLDRTGAFEPVPGGHHNPHEPGWEHYPSKKHCSWKTTRGAPVLQVTLWKRSLVHVAQESMKLAEYVAELDLDRKAGAAHVAEALGNHLPALWGGEQLLTHHYDINQDLAWNWGIVPFRLEAGE